MGSVLSPWTGLAACIPFSASPSKWKVLLGSIFRKNISTIIKSSWYELQISLFQCYLKPLRAQHWTDTGLHFLIIWQEEAFLDSVQLIWYPTCADCLHCCCPLYTQWQMWDPARGSLLLLHKKLEQRQKGIFSENSFTNSPQESA